MEDRMSINFHVSFNDHGESALSKIAKGMVTAYDWLSGPPMSEKDRINHELAVTEGERRIGSVSL
jgi:hypothetical protein